MGYLDNLQLISGIDLRIDSLNFTLHQPKMFEIAVLGESDYFLALSIFKMSTDTLKVPAANITNWMVFKEALGQEVPGVKDVPGLITKFLQLFVKEKIMIGPRSLMIQSKDGIANIEPEQFDEFRLYILEVGGSSLLSSNEEEFKPGNKRAAEIAEKMKKARARVAAQKAAENKSDGFLAKYMRSVASVTSHAIGDVTQMTLMQMNDILQTYLAWESYDLEVRSRLAGAKNDDKLEHWMARSIGRSTTSIETVNC